MAKREIWVVDTGLRIELEDEILRFAMSMKRKFDETGEGDSYKQTSKQHLMFKLMEEFAELLEAIRHNTIGKDEECIDVALLCMMIKETSSDFREDNRGATYSRKALCSCLRELEWNEIKRHWCCPVHQEKTEGHSKEKRSMKFGGIYHL